MSFPLPPRIAKKLPIHNSWELLIGKLPIPLPMFYYFESIREALANTLYIFRGRHRWVEKGGGRKTSRITPLPKRGFGPPLVRYVFHPPQVSVLCFACTKIHGRADQKLSWRGRKIPGEQVLWYVFLPYVYAPPPPIPRKRVVLANVPSFRYSMEFFMQGGGGGGLEGATTLLHFSKCSRPFIQSTKSTLSNLKSCNPVGGTPSSTA